MQTIKCCNDFPDVRYLYRYYIATIHCQNCNAQRDIRIPKHIPPYQFEQYTNKKYNEIIEEEGELMNQITNEIEGLKNGMKLLNYKGIL